MKRTIYLILKRFLSKNAPKKSIRMFNGVFVINNQDMFIYIAIIRSVCYTLKR